MKKIVIIWTGTSWYLTAALLSHYFWENAVIILVGDFDWNSTIRVWEATITGINRVFNDLGINILKDISSSTIKLWINFVNWYGDNRWFHGFNLKWISDYGYLSIFYVYQKIRSNLSFSDYVYELTKLEQGLIYANLDHFMDYAYHISTEDLQQYLFKYLYWKVKYVKGKANSYLYDSEGNIRSIVLSGNNIIDNVDFIIDCQGFSSNIYFTNNFFYDFTSTWLINNRAIIFWKSYDEIWKKFQRPYVTSIAMDYWWVWLIPLKNMVSIGYVFPQEMVDDIKIIDEMKKKLDIQVKYNEIKVINFKSWFYQYSWFKNVLKIWLASWFIEPLESTGLSLIYSSIYKFIDLYNDGNYTQDTINKYNLWVRNNMISLRDFILFHYLIADKSNTYWDLVKKIILSANIIKLRKLFNKFSLNIDYLSKLDLSWLNDYLGFYSYLLVYLAFWYKNISDIKLKKFIQKYQILKFLQLKKSSLNMISYLRYLNQKKWG